MQTSLFSDTEIQSVSVSNSKFPKLNDKSYKITYSDKLSRDLKCALWMAIAQYRVNYDCLMTGLYPNGKKINLSEVEEKLTIAMEWLEPKSFYFEGFENKLHQKINQKIQKDGKK